MPNFERELFNIISSVKSQIRAQPLDLGGVYASGGGSGGPAGGFTGYLPQTRVAYDLSEAALSGVPPSGQSLLDNLNHIRYDVANMAFLSLVDSPSSYSGYSGYSVVVKNTEDGLEFGLRSGELHDNSDANTSIPPTNNELESAFGTAASNGDGWLGILDVNGSGSDVFLIASQGSNYFYQQMTLAS